MDVDAGRRTRQKITAWSTLEARTGHRDRKDTKMTDKEMLDEIELLKDPKKTKLGYNILEQFIWAIACLLFASYDWRLAVGLLLFDIQFNMQRFRERWNDIHFIKRILIENQKSKEKTTN